MLYNYLNAFKSRVDILEHYGAIIRSDKPYLKVVKNEIVESAAKETKKEEQLAISIATARKKLIAIAFLKRADKKRYVMLWSKLVSILPTFVLI